MRITLAVGLIAVLSTACIEAGITGVGDDPAQDQGGQTGSDDTGGSGSGGSTTSPRLSATVDQTSMSTELGVTETLMVTLKSENGFAGTVPVVADAAGTMAGFTITANPTSVDLAAGETKTVSVTIKIPTDAADLAPQLKVDLGGSAPTSVTTNLAIVQQLHIDLPSGLGMTAHTNMLPVGAPMRVRMNTKIIFHNSDGTVHRIHGDGGIPHESTSDATAGAPNTDYTVTVTDAGDWYCHDHEGGGQARLVNVVP